MGSPPLEIIQRYIDAGPDDHKQVNDIISDLTSPVEQALSETSGSPNAEEQLWTLWRAVIASARKMPQADAERKGMLSDLILSIQERKVVTANDSSEPRIHEMTVWSDLPILGWALRKSWNDAATDTDAAENREEWINLNAWCATLITQAFGQARKQPDPTLCGLWTIREALESDKNVSPTAVSAAAVWFRDASTVIWDLCSTEKTFDGKIAKPGPLFGSEEWRGFSKNRWQAWDDRLSDIDQSGKLDEQVTSLVKDALTQMRAMAQM